MKEEGTAKSSRLQRNTKICFGELEYELHAAFAKVSTKILAR
jgi:hypothetical protein